MSRRRRKNKPAEQRGPAENGRGGLAPAVAKPLASALGLVLVVGAAVYGLERLKGHVYARPEYAPPMKVELEVPPGAEWVDREGWRPRILASIQLPDGQGCTDETLLPDIAEQVMHTGWVAGVNRVVQETDGTIRVACDFRRPVAMVLHEGVYFPVDEQSYRLPEAYTRVSDSGWIQIVGIESPAPKAGESYRDQDGDARAGIALASLIFQQQFASRIGAIDVRNHGGRRDPRRDHILIWPRKGEPIIWGSAIGEECEETTAADKLRVLAKHFRAGSPQVRIDVSVLPNAWIERTPHAVRTADGSRTRD